eukprot:gene20078-20615_t
MSSDGDHGKGRKWVKRGAQPLADLTGSLLAPAAKKRGFASVDLFAYWPEIVGPAYADHTQPERLSWPRRLEDGGEQGFVPATLVVRCEGARALLLQHEEPVIVERINAIFGYKAVAKLRIVQKPIERFTVTRPKALPPLSAAAERDLAREVAVIADPGLREALTRLGRAVKASALVPTTRGNKRSGRPEVLVTRRRLLNTSLTAATLAASLPLAACGGDDSSVDVAELMKPGAVPDKILGKSDAPVTVIEYSSLGCPHCAAFHKSIFPHLKTTYIDTGKVRFISRDF